ncbi:MAG: division/cell wall cluster transcriptional repressor MraZ [Gemmatimonadota bacterium]|jgi:MraZ protein|nr:division/cell wall cluster transcriptional repressor MraZ [Gemmatimonadota bacterium]
MSGFLGGYVHQVDEKGRLSLPASFRRDLAENEPLVVVQVDERSLTLYPGPAWRELSERLMELRRKNPEYRGFVLEVTSRAVEVTPDRSGRVLIPAKLLQAVGISESAMLVGALDRIELWDPAQYEASRPVRTAELDRLAREVFS